MKAMSLREPTTKRLLARARDGDRQALERLFVRAYPDLLQAARIRMGAVLRARLETRDVAQSAYYEAFRDLHRYRYQGQGSFYRWLLGILENKIRNRIDFFRAKKRDLRREKRLADASSAPAPATTPTQRLVRSEERERLEAAMDRLPEEHRDVIISRYYLRMPWREIGEHLDRSEEAAQMLCRRALRKLREIYERPGD